MRAMLAALGAGAVLWLSSIPTHAEDYVVTIGKGLTGLMAFVGVPETNGIRLAADELNARKFLGEGNRIALRIEDDAGDRNQLVTLVNRAATIDKSLVFLGPASSGIATAVAPMTNELQLPMMAPAITTAPLRFGPWYLKITTSPEGSIRPIARYAAERRKVKRPVIIYCRDNDGHTTNARTFRDGVTAAGIPIAEERTILTTDTDFTAVATRVAALDPDSIYLGANATQAANLVLQLKQAGVAADVALFGSSGLGTEYIAAGGAQTDGTYLSTDYNIEVPSALNQNFLRSYRERFGLDPDNWAAVGYSEMLIVAQAIKDAMPNPTRAKVLDAITKLKDFPVLIGDGRWSLGEDRIPTYEPQVVMIKGGKFVSAP